MPNCVATPYFFGRFGHHTRLMDRVGQRLFAIDVQAGANGANRGRGVVMVGSADHDGIDLAGFFGQHLAVVGIGSCSGEVGSRSIQVVLVHVDQRDDTLMLQSSDVG